MRPSMRIMRATSRTSRTRPSMGSINIPEKTPVSQGPIGRLAEQTAYFDVFSMEMPNFGIATSLAETCVSP